MIRREVKVCEALHARPLDRFVRLARTLKAQITLHHGPKQADGKNVVQLLLLAVPAGAEVTLEVDGPDAEAAVGQLEEQLTVAAESEASPPPPKPATGDNQPESQDKDESTLVRGAPGAPGRGVGSVRWIRPEARQREAGTASEELAIVREALRVAMVTTRHLARDDDPFCDIFRAQLSLLEDPGLQQELERRVALDASAEAAVLDHFADLEQQFSAMDSDFFRARHADVADVRDRLLESTEEAARTLLLYFPGDEPPKNSALASSPDLTFELLVLVLPEATPSRMASLDPGKVAAVISLRGGATSHAAIVARGRGVPLVFADAGAMAGVEDDQRVLVDGDTGAICSATKEQAKAARPTPPAEPQVPAAWSPPGHGEPAVHANLGAPGDLAAALAAGCDGCGLLRSELLYQGRSEAPTVEEQAEAYGRVAAALAPRPVVVRLFDAGSDKPLAFLPGPGGEPNPALGLRGLRLLRQHPRVLEQQVQAVALAREQTGHALSAMVPMVLDAGDLGPIRDLVGDRCSVGAMVETPAAALLAPSLAAEADFLSIGTNDLTQYLLAADRETAGAITLHPAVLRAVADVAHAAREAGISCSICGELAGDLRAAPLLAGLGLTLSVAPALAPRVRQTLGRWTAEEMTRLATRALQCFDPQALEDLLEAGDKPSPYVSSNVPDEERGDRT